MSVLRGKFVEQKLMVTYSFRCDQFTTVTDMFFAHFVVLPKSDLEVQQTHLCLLQVRATNFTITTVYFMSMKLTKQSALCSSNVNGRTTQAANAGPPSSADAFSADKTSPT